MTISMADQRKQNIIQAVRDYGKRLFYFIRGRVNTDEDAEDILQDVWYQFSNVLENEPIEQTSAWLFRVARNRIIDKYRKRRTESLEEEMFTDDDEGGFSLKEILLAENATPETEHLRNLFWEQLFSALDELPEEQRQVFVWNELEDISFNKIAKRTGEKINTLISRKRYAVLHLRKRLEQLYKEIIEQ
ncbi:MAG TPA: sigma-70 family RNA polymerase sigma factor [Chitinophagaceae bacterium]|jgi:RNA polymerase sigma factor (sigma-70 family)|nr:sigma-70 family RNA polymerase sigma factor [Chitinophagaceae bacterium]